MHRGYIIKLFVLTTKPLRININTYGGLFKTPLNVVNQQKFYAFLADLGIEFHNLVDSYKLNLFAVFQFFNDF
jgi:hypothetical protein